MLQELFANIESVRTLVAANVANGLQSFLRIVGGLPAVQRLSAEILAHPELARQVLAHLLRLTSFRIDPRYENPNDVAFAVYITVLAGTAPDLLAPAVDAVARAQNCRWATQVAELANPGQVRGSGEETQAVGSAGGHYACSYMHVGASIDALLPTWLLPGARHTITGPPELAARYAENLHALAEPLRGRTFVVRVNTPTTDRAIAA